MKFSLCLSQGGIFGELMSSSVISVSGVGYVFTCGQLEYSPDKAVTGTQRTVNRYLVSTSELQRRCSPPECYSNNTVVSYLRKAKAKKRNIEEKLTGLGVQPTKRTKLTSLCTKLCEDECSELVSDVMFLAAKFMPQKKVVQEMCENEDIHDSISKAESCR
ncbi:hypothetical protein E1301_Tti023673 [Triplophysa tibetana]|uniref:Transcription factor AP-2 C-terminal domain-containing protein n=1 Tax=Triplophysa tibetana TaxID=1572043 RepID=A0A5A9MSZ8_9TELE|nr:hypothetical protein E1301_Tti023673 [Triplophysa tibetana]